MSPRRPLALRFALQHPQELAAGFPFGAGAAAERGGFHQRPAAELKAGMLAPREAPGDFQQPLPRQGEVVNAGRVTGSGKAGFDEYRGFPFSRLVLRRQDRRDQGQPDGGPRPGAAGPARRRVLLRAARH